MHQIDPRGPLTHRTVLAIATPVMAANVSTPLIGVVDTAVVGRLPDPAYIGAVAVGTLVFSFVFWAFGFLRMGTTGLTAQALGAGDANGVGGVLGRALLIALAAGLTLLAVQSPIREIAFRLLDASEQVEVLGRVYFDIRIWAAPFTLANYALLGWFIGLGRTGLGLLLQLVLNLTNAALDALFVVGFGWDVAGVALGTVLAEGIAVGIGLTLAIRYFRKNPGSFLRDRLLVGDRLRQTVNVGGNIMIRSIALLFVFAWFTARGAVQGDRILAANAILLHFVSVSAYFLDGLAFAAEALVGRAVGAGDRQALKAAVRTTTLWAGGVALAMSMVLLGVGPAFISQLTADPLSQATARTYLPWAVAAPLLGVWAFQLDGIFLGATRTADMRNAMLVSLAIFICAWWALTPWANHGLWAALYVHYVARIATLGYYYPRLGRSILYKETPN